MASSGKTWIAHYLYAAADGEMRSVMKSIVATSYETSMEAAAKLAPAEEFVVSLSEQSEEQFLGAVRQQAAGLTDQSIDSETLEALYDDEEEEDGD